MSPKKRKRKDYLRVLLELKQLIAEVLPKDELRAIQQQWRRIFAKRVVYLTGNEIYRGFDWHAFSYSLVHSVDGEKAIQSYHNESCTDFYVLPHMNEWNGYKCQSSNLPQFNRGGIDVYICPLDFKWTMVFTHEGDRSGPYFTRAEWADMETDPKTK